ncbi:MAG: hypothetical protein LBQ24_07375 [Candidatus Peribacteria bacterium]|nr:hypothetical protein [Candidatus Peribacteria bacterium]
MFQSTIQFNVFKSKSAQISSNFLKISGVLSTMSTLISLICKISHSSIASLIFIIVSPVFSSQFFKAS